jgi:NADPH:quinone reductase-like Zn-dependent oxidoreductase
VRAVLPLSEPRAPALRIGDLPDPVPGPGEVLVAVEAAGLNHADVHQMRGHYPPPPGESDIPGLECAGRVVGKEGPGLWQPGARVMALVGGGAHATLAAIPAGQLMPIPDNLSFVEAAAIPEAALTAWTNLVAEGSCRRGKRSW